MWLADTCLFWIKPSYYEFVKCIGQHQRQTKNSYSYCILEQHNHPLMEGSNKTNVDRSKMYFNSLILSC